MQSTIQNYGFDEQKNESLMELLGDKYSRIILGTVMTEPKSAVQICNETKIPISTTYRRLQSLYDNRLVRISGEISNEGKKYFLYKSKIKTISANFDGKSVQVRVVPSNESSQM